MPHDTKTWSAISGHTAQAHKQPQKNCSNTVDKVAMSQEQNNDEMQLSTAMVLLNVQNTDTYIAQLFRISVITRDSQVLVNIMATHVANIKTLPI
jgi:hypothetical protein